MPPQLKFASAGPANVSAKSDSDSRNDGSDEDRMERDINFEIEASSETVEDSQKEEPIDDEDGIIIKLEIVKMSCPTLHKR